MLVNLPAYYYLRDRVMVLKNTRDVGRSITKPRGCFPRETTAAYWIFQPERANAIRASALEISEDGVEELSRRPDRYSTHAHSLLIDGPGVGPGQTKA